VEEPIDPKELIAHRKPNHEEKVTSDPWIYHTAILIMQRTQKHTIQFIDRLTGMKEGGRRVQTHLSMMSQISG
jgi:hypothetical protein